MAFQQPSIPMTSQGSTQDPHNSGFVPNMNPWMRFPPSVMPWTMENRPQVVRFGEPFDEDECFGVPCPKLKVSKRKSDLDFNPKPSKMHISEEKMAAQMKNMHISNTYTGGQGCSDGMESSGECLLPTLVLSKEVQSLPSFHEPLLPQSLVARQDKSSTALVLWKPPGGSISAQILSSLRSTDQDEDVEADTGNNNSFTPDLNSMTSQGFGGSSTDMEL